MSGANILLFIDDIIDAREVLTPLRVLPLLGYVVHVASPRRKAGDKVRLSRAKSLFATGGSVIEQPSVTLNATLADATLSEFDALVIAMGRTSQSFLQDDHVLKIIRLFAGEAGKHVIGVCGGVQSLIAADVVRGHRVTCNPELASDVRLAGAEYVETTPSGAVLDRDLITGIEGDYFPEWIALLQDALRQGERENREYPPASRTSVCWPNEGLDTASPPSRFDQGMLTLEAISGENYKKFIQTLNRLSPDFGVLLVETGYADLISRPALTLKSRELATVATLVTLGNATSALKFHCAGMLNTGWSARELVETVLHAVVYAGFPAVSNALRLVSDVLREHKIDPESSRDELPSGNREIPAEVLTLMVAHDALGGRIEPVLATLISKFVYGEIWSRPGLSVKDRQLATLAMAMTKGNQVAAVCKHIKGCLMMGWTRAQLVEVLIQMTGYIGWPMTLAVAGPVLEVFDRFDEEGLPPIPKDPIAREVFEVQAISPVPGALAHKGCATSCKQKFNVADDIGAVLARYTTEFFGAKTVGRSGKLDGKTREIAIIAALTATGRTVDTESLESHVNTAIDLGVQWCEIVEAMELMLPYTGFEAVKQAMGYAHATGEERPFT